LRCCSGDIDAEEAEREEEGGYVEGWTGEDYGVCEVHYDELFQHVSGRSGREEFGGADAVPERLLKAEEDVAEGVVVREEFYLAGTVEEDVVVCTYQSP